MIIWIGATIGAATAAFLVGGFWYGFLFARQAAALSPAYAATAMSGATMLFEFVRCLALATALAVLLRWTGLQTVPQAFALALLIWAGFQAAGLAGAVVHEGYPVALYAIHTGDALAKALVAALVLVVVTPRFA